MRLRDRMIYAGIVTSDLKRRHPVHIREFYRDLLHVCDDHGRFEANATLLRAVLYAPILDRVRVLDVQRYLQILHVAGDITLYTVRGKGLGKVSKWRQLRLKVRVADYPDEDGVEELPLADLPLPHPVVDPPPDSLVKEGKKEGSVSRKRSSSPGATHTHTNNVLARDHMENLKVRWPEHDVGAALRNAERYVRRERGEGALVELNWFERCWMPREPKNRSKVAAVVAVNEPSNFQEWFLGRYEHPPSKPWKDLTNEQRDYYLRQMGSAAQYDLAAGGVA